MIRLPLGVVVAAMVLAGAVGCSSSGGTGPAATGGPSATAAAPTSPSPTAAKVYRLPASMCAAADFSPIADLYPTPDSKPLLNVSDSCATGRTSPTAVLAVSVSADPLPAGFGPHFMDTGRRVVADTHDISGVGADAYWTGDGVKTIKLVTYDANLALTIEVNALSSKDRFPADMPQRVGRIANGTFARLAT